MSTMTKALNIRWSTATYYVIMTRYGVAVAREKQKSAQAYNLSNLDFYSLSLLS